MKIIGITGGVGAGKSTILSYLQETYGAYLILADEVGHIVMEPGQECYGQVIDLFGKEVVKEDETLDRKKIADLVFSDSAKLEALNSVVHPAVKKWIINCLKEQEQAGCPLCVVEAALLLEEQYDRFCDEVWYVYAEEEVRIQRLMENRGYTRQKSLDIIKNQASESYFRAYADYVIENNGNLEETWKQIDEGVKKHEIL